MIATIKGSTVGLPVGANEKFTAMLPQIRRCLNFCLRSAPRRCREEYMTACIANAYCAFAALVKRGKQDVACATVLAKFAVMQVYDGRDVGTSANSLDVLSGKAQRRWGIEMLPLQKQVPAGGWEDLVVEDKHAGPAEIAAVRLDFRAWLRRLNRTKRAVALYLARGERTSDVAKRFRLSAARISQLRDELRHSWERFQAVEAVQAAV
jgi:hypothetical protein